MHQKLLSHLNHMMKTSITSCSFSSGSTIGLPCPSEIVAWSRHILGLRMHAMEGINVSLQLFTSCMLSMSCSIRNHIISGETSFNESFFILPFTCVGTCSNLQSRKSCTLHTSLDLNHILHGRYNSKLTGT